ncbi:MAG: RHS repeat-associated core domain-containing protein, partial [Paenibacillus sp.]|nr:RHS repeat-associated core domain-containing protein [Paenibacillus sp.]
DKETGLYFLKSRYYDPEIGRFTSKDRFAGFENRPASQNPYTYCEGDPVNRVDPDGQGCRETTQLVLAGVGVVASFIVLMPVSAPVLAGAIIVGALATAGSATIDYYSWRNVEMGNEKYATNTFLNLASFIPGGTLVKFLQHQAAIGQLGASVYEFSKTQQEPKTIRSDYLKPKAKNKHIATKRKPIKKKSSIQRVA